MKRKSLFNNEYMNSFLTKCAVTNVATVFIVKMKRPIPSDQSVEPSSMRYGPFGPGQL